jgi:hypothetical protein
MTDSVDPVQEGRQKLGRLAELPYAFAHQQKISDAVDWNDPRLDFVLREFLHQVPAPNFRQWEYGMTFSLLALHNAFGPGKRGIAFGAGREPLIYAIASLVDHLVVTDIYSHSTIWTTAKTDSPRNYILGTIPFPCDASRIGVMSMDMRRAALASHSFDFAYSVSSFEHIGMEEDFIQHLMEVRRVLKKNGIYVFTTEFRIHEKSTEIRGNHAFGFNQLMRIIDASGFDIEPVFDASTQEIALNRPRVQMDTFLADPFFLREQETFIIREHCGAISVPCTLVLTNRQCDVKTSCRLIGFEQTRTFLENSVEREAATRYRDWMHLSPFSFYADRRSSYYMPHREQMDASRAAEIQNGIFFGTTYLHYGESPMEARITLLANPKAHKMKLWLLVHQWSLDDISDITAVERQEICLDGKRNRAGQVVLKFKAKKGFTYSILGKFMKESGLFSLIDVAVRNSPA